MQPVNNIKETIDELFTQCVSKDEDLASSEIYTISAEQYTDVFSWQSRLGGLLMGITIDKVRYISNGALMINSFAMLHTKEWKVFKILFQELGDSWRLHWGRQAEKMENPNPFPAVLDAIKSWDDDLEELTPLASSESYTFLKTQDKKLVTVYQPYFEFCVDHGFSLDDVKGSHDPITLTHGDSLGFAGVLMPIKIGKRASREVIWNLDEALSLLKEEAGA